MNPIGSPIIIGTQGWEAELEAATSGLVKDLWAGFTPVSPDDIASLEAAIKRTLPADLRSFLAKIGAGDFPDEFGGGIFNPSEIVEGCAGPLLMLLGSSPWATDEDQRAFYTSRGAFNPNPVKFVSGITYYNGVDLLDLVQVGYDGMSCYYQVFCEGASSGTGFCRITPEQTLGDRCVSFSEGLRMILSRFHELRES